MDNIKELDKKYIAGTYNRFDLELVEGKGSKLFDEKGKMYIDLGSGIAVNSFGISDPVWTEAVTKQINTLNHTSNLYYSVPQVKLAELMCEKTGMKKVFFCNSGAEANECAIKAARKYSSDKYGEGRNVIITLKNSFHGRTITTLSATGQDVFHKDFGPFTEGFRYAVAGDYDGTVALNSDGKVCAVMLELVQGEGGVIAQSKEYIEKLAAYCKENDVLLVIDEVQTGNGRTGELYAFINYGLKPDIVSTAKGLAGGLPFGACMLGEKCENTLNAGSHGSTFGGNPVCAAGALSVFSRLDEKLLNEVKEKSKYIFDNLSQAKGVEAVTGLGLMIGIKISGDAKAAVLKAMEKGVIVLTAKDKIRLLPALNIPMEELKKAVNILKEAIAEVTA